LLPNRDELDTIKPLSHRTPKEIIRIVNQGEPEWSIKRRISKGLSRRDLRVDLRVKGEIYQFVDELSNIVDISVNELLKAAMMYGAIHLPRDLKLLRHTMDILKLLHRSVRNRAVQEIISRLFDVDMFYGYFAGKHKLQSIYPFYWVWGCLNEQSRKTSVHISTIRRLAIYKFLGNCDELGNTKNYFKQQYLDFLVKTTMLCQSMVEVGTSSALSVIIEPEFINKLNKKAIVIKKLDERIYNMIMEVLK